MRWLVVILLLSSCVTEKKAVKWMDDHKGSSSAYCLDRYPVQELIDTVYADPDMTAYDAAYNELWDYMESLRDSIKVEYEVRDSIRYVYRTKFKTITNTQTITVVKKDSAQTTQYTDQIQRLQHQLEITQKVANAKMTKILYIAIGTIAAMAYQIRRLLRKTKK